MGDFYLNSKYAEFKKSCEIKTIDSKDEKNSKKRYFRKLQKEYHNIRITDHSQKIIKRMAKNNIVFNPYKIACKIAEYYGSLNVDASLRGWDDPSRYSDFVFRDKLVYFFINNTSQNVLKKIKKEPTLVGKIKIIADNQKHFIVKEPEWLK